MLFRHTKHLNHEAFWLSSSTAAAVVVVIVVTDIDEDPVLLTCLVRGWKNSHDLLWD